tara:strand:+ start:1119 stop:1310 length:192 start_codon:yes stop_codon:yes gene_type:complete
MNPLICGWCGGWTRPQFVKGHYQCGRCFSPLMDCCDGEQAQPSCQSIEDETVSSTHCEIEENL